TALLLPSFDEVSADKAKYAESFRIQSENTDPVTARPLIEQYGNNRYIVQNTPMRPLTTQEMDDIYELPYMNVWHPMYDSLGGVPAFKDVRFSLTSNRGCFGGCSFCALSFHQGRIIQARSHESLLCEAEAMTKEKDFKGYIYDVGGPTADFRQPACKKQLDKGVCKNRQCLYPKPCKNLIADHSDYVSLLGKLRKLPGVKKVFIRSGIRFDYVLADKSDEFLRVLCRHHISGQLRVAPEHVSGNVLRLMGKPENGVYKEFVRRFDKINKETGKQQYVLPYLISSHPGSTLEDAVMLAESIRDMGYMPEQVQDFYPTPSTVSTCMYYTGLDPRTMERVYVPKNAHEKAMQRALMQYRRPENYELVKEALLKCGRADLIGFDRDRCLIPPRKIKNGKNNEKAENAKNIKPQRRQGDTRRTADAGDRRGNKGRRRA
ncbi:MAG: YgiQ family radical SAM protein, partial [Lachnospiraceae bacterium]|nr:YgiQ family radical SAM protein [Lachnospiraceae bacterium]